MALKGPNKSYVFQMALHTEIEQNIFRQSQKNMTTPEGGSFLSFNKWRVSLISPGRAYESVAV